MDPLISGWVQKQNNLCTGNHNLEHCPSTSTERLFREKVCLNVSGTTNLLYHCQYDQRHRQFLEFMAKSHKCPKGNGMILFNKIHSSFQRFCFTPDILIVFPKCYLIGHQLYAILNKTKTKLHFEDSMLLSIYPTVSSNVSI